MLNYDSLFCEMDTNEIISFHTEQKAASKKATVYFKDQRAIIFIAFKALKYLYYQI